MICSIISNFSTKADALKMGKQLIEQDLIVCCNISEVLSQYKWKGSYYEEKEYSASFKTSKEKKEQVIKYINKHHPYEIPLISSKILDVNNSYKKWMDDMLR